MAGMKGKLGMLALMGALFSGGAENSNPLRPQDIDPRPPKKPIPKGCQRYFFNEDGPCPEPMAKIYFDAMTPKNARKKYEKWLETYKPNNQ
jgi:hypothetical protein